jgi:signal transduction histidine kinase
LSSLDPIGTRPAASHHVARAGVEERPGAEHRALVAVATAEDVESGMRAVVEIVRDVAGARRVEWREGGGRAARVVAGDRRPGRRSRRLSLGPVGAIVVVDGPRATRAAAVLAAVAPVLRRRWAEERLGRAAAQLAWRNAALEQFAGLVAHELKTPLQAALVAEDPSRWVHEALALIDELLEASREPGLGCASPAACLGEAVRDLGAADVAITVDLPAQLPLPSTPLRVILRNLLRNAIAAGARAIHVSAARSADTWTLVVRDDGEGPGDGYRAGSGLGLSLCQGIASRYGGSLALAPAPSGGTQARLLLKEAA